MRIQLCHHIRSKRRPKKRKTTLADLIYSELNRLEIDLPQATIRTSIDKAIDKWVNS